MAVKTFTTAGVNNLWSNPANWDLSTAPVDNDSVVIPLGQICEFDVDTSAWANGIAGITITGTLKLTRTTGTYYMKIKAATTIAGEGTFDCGTSGDAIPFATKHTITGGSGWYIQGAGGLTMTVYAAEPFIKTVSLTQNELAGATVLHVDTDVTADIWTDGDTIHIANGSPSSNNESRVIAAGGIAAGAITITSGLTAAKVSGSYVTLITRNLSFSGGSVFCNFAANKLTFAGGVCTATSTAFSTCTSPTVGGGVIANCQYAIAYGSGTNITGGVFSGNANVTSLSNANIISGGVFVGNTTIFNSALGSTISGGVFYGNKVVLMSCIDSKLIGGTFLRTGNGNDYAVIMGSFAELKHVVMQLNEYDIRNSVIKAYNTFFGSSSEVYGYATFSKYSYSESIDHDQVAGAYKAWTKGGVTSSQAVTVPTGYTKAMQTVLENAAVEGYWQKEFTVGAGASVNFTMNLRKATSMTYLPRCIIFNKASTDPFAGGAGLNTFTMTDSIDTWEQSVYTYTNTTSEDVTLVVRFQGMAASGSFYSALDVEVINVDLTSALAKLDVIDTVVDAIKLKTDALPESVLTSIVEGTYTLQDILKIVAAVTAGKASGGGTTEITFRDLADTKDRIVATVDSSGNRTNVTKTLT